mgnify:CR=1 FL=1
MVVTPKPIKWYVVGSDHGDHTAGNAALPKDITTIVTPYSKGQMKIDVPAMSGDKQVINVGGIEVQALYLGRAHTGGDLVVYLPKQKILFMSEVFLNRVFPAMRSALAKALGIEPEQINLKAKTNEVMDAIGRGDIRETIQASGEIALSLHHGQTNQRLCAGQKNAAALQRVFVVQLNGLQGLAYVFGQGGVHDLSPMGYCCSPV